MAYDWKRVAMSLPAPIREMWYHVGALNDARMEDESAIWLGEKPGAMSAHVRACVRCQEDWARQIMREHVEAVLMRVIER